MRKQLCSLAVCTLFGLGVALATPQNQDQPAAPPPATSGQTQGHHQADPNRQLQRLTKRLNLTQDQQNQLLPILTDRQQQMQNLFSDNSLSRKDRREKMRAIREDSENKIKAVLTDDQKQTYDQMQQKMHERMQRRHENQQQNNNK